MYCRDGEWWSGVFRGWAESQDERGLREGFRDWRSVHIRGDDSLDRETFGSLMRLCRQVLVVRKAIQHALFSTLVVSLGSLPCSESRSPTYSLCDLESYRSRAAGCGSVALLYLVNDSNGWPRRGEVNGWLLR